MGDIVHEVEELAATACVEITLLGQNVNSYGRDLGAGPVPAAVRRSPAHARRGRRHRADPLHVAAPQGPPARDDRGDGRVRARLRAPAPAAAVGQRPHARPDAPRATPPSATSSGSPRRAPRSTILRSPPTSSSASPARPTTTSRARSRSSTPPTYDAAYTFVFSPRPGHRSGRRWSTTSSRPRSTQERMQRLVEVVERHALRASTRRASGASRRCSSKDRPRRTRPMWSGRTRQNKLVHFAPDAATARRATSSTCRDRAAAAALAARRVRRASCSPAPRRARAHPGRGGVTRHLAIVGADRVGQVGVGAGARTPSSATSRSSRSTRCRSTAGMDIGTAKPTRGRARRGAAPSRRRRRSRGRVVGARHAGHGARARDRRHRSARPARGARRRHRACTCAPSSTGSTFRPSDAAERAALEARDGDRRRTCAPRTPSCGALDPVAAARIEPGNRRRIVRALEVIELTGRPFSSFGPGLDDVRPAGARRRARRHRAARRRDRRERIADAVRGDARRRASSTRCARSRRRPGGLVAHRPPGHRLQGGAGRSSTDRLGFARRRRSTRPCGGPAGSPAASACGSGAIPRIQLADGRAEIPTSVAAVLARWEHRTAATPIESTLMSRMHLAKLHATGNDFLVRLALEPASRRPRRPRPRSRRSATGTAASVPTGSSRSAPARRRRLHDDACRTPTAARPR